jgi:hypothetical protein
MNALTDLLGRDTSGPLGQVQMASNRMGAGVSISLHGAARNLLVKAARAVAAADEPRAVGYIERTVRLPFDERDQIDPGWWGAHMLMFVTVTDVLEEAERSDRSWLDAAEDLFESLDRYGRAALGDTLAAIALDYELSPQEFRRIKKITAGASSSEWVDMAPSELAERVRPVLTVVRATVAYRRALALLAPDPPG